MIDVGQGHLKVGHLYKRKHDAIVTEYFLHVSVTKDIEEFYLEIIKRWILFHETNNTELKNFVEIRKQVIWGNKFIKFQNKPLIMHNWIHSDFIYINDIIDDNGKIAQDKILKKLRNTKNWIAEISKVKNSILTSWLKA